MMSEQINELAAALAKAQGAMGNAVMNRVNPHFKSKYADMGSVLDAIRPPLSANGLSVVQPMQVTDKGLILRTILMHASGQYIATEYPLPQVANQQAMGSALTYARRYSLSALVCNSSDEDDDANAAMPIKTSSPAKISQAEWQDLCQLIERKETSSEMVCKHFKVASLADITTDRLGTIRAAIEAKPDRVFEQAAE